MRFSYATWLTPSTPEGFSEIQAGYTITGANGWATQGLCGFVKGGTCPFASWTPMPGNVSFTYGRRIEFSDDDFTHLGAAGLELGTGTSDSRVRGNTFTDISGNGLEIGGVDGRTPADHVEVTDNHLYALPREFHGSVGILNGYTQHNTIAHNQLDHLGYSAISMGWGGWPDKVGSPATPNPSHDNAVSDNLIFDYMQMFDDGGGIYTQGLTGTSQADGEKVTGNVIHDQWGLGKSVYTDNGCTYETVEGNVLYGASYANVASRHTDYRDQLGNNDPTLVKDNWWEEGTADGDNKGLVTTGNHIMASPSDAPAAIVAAAGIEPAYRSVLSRTPGAVSVPEAPSRVGTSTAGADALYAIFNPVFADGGSPVRSYTAHALRPDGTEAARQTVSAADYKRLAYIRIGGLPAGGGLHRHCHRCQRAREQRPVPRIRPARPDGGHRAPRRADRPETPYRGDGRDARLDAAQEHGGRQGHRLPPDGLRRPHHRGHRPGRDGRTALGQGDVPGDRRPQARHQLHGDSRLRHRGGRGPGGHRHGDHHGRIGTGTDSRTRRTPAGTAHRSARRHAGDCYVSGRSSEWLFPGHRPGQEMNPDSLQVHLREIGVPPQRGRAPAIRQLVTSTCEPTGPEAGSLAKSRTVLARGCASGTSEGTAESVRRAVSDRAGDRLDRLIGIAEPDGRQVDAPLRHVRARCLSEGGPEAPGQRRPGDARRSGQGLRAPGVFRLGVDTCQSVAHDRITHRSQP